MPSWANRITRHFWATRCGVVPERTNDSSCFLAASSTERAVAVGNMTRLNHDQAVLSIVMRDGTLAVTRTRGCLHPDQHILNATQNSLCRAVNRRRGRCACRASNCRRRARFSRTRSARQLKELTNQPRKCRSDTIMARILAETTESSFAPSHSFRRCTTFWRGTGGTLWLSRTRLINIFSVQGGKILSSRDSLAVVAERLKAICTLQGAKE